MVGHVLKVTRDEGQALEQRPEIHLGQRLQREEYERERGRKSKNYKDDEQKKEKEN